MLAEDAPLFASVVLCSFARLKIPPFISTSPAWRGETLESPQDPIVELESVSPDNRETCKPLSMTITRLREWVAYPSGSGSAILVLSNFVLGGLDWLWPIHLHIFCPGPALRMTAEKPSC